ncbi:hypothetical protein SAMN05216353_1251 [Halobacillus alkaliphilus]|uniref:Lipoprotein n=1 Tax=Halobacillus alkaliphilus TaxID=396056 RepID=A0A1I2PG35_9BACI|nr:hypothetical protein [Halobacillus alkaliphilus]SFG14500.1 hypothetical protein SAMN05216353_1251 [Halobacillus alkaliphilus]
MRRCLLITAAFFSFVLMTGCSNAEALDITDKSKIVLIPDGDGGEALTISTFIKNNSDQTSEPFYIEFEILNNQLQSKLKESKLIVGENYSGDPPGEVYKVKSHTTLQAGSTLRINGKIEEAALKKIITQNNAVKVNLLSKNNNLIKSSYINGFAKDLTTDGIDDSK